MSEEVAHRIDLLRRERAELYHMLEDADPSADVNNASIAKGFLHEQIEALDRQMEDLGRARRPY